METLTVKQEFKDLCPPLSEEEREQLEANLIADGRAIDPIKVWAGTIIDGHDRYELCTKNKIPFTTEELEFDSEDEAVDWIATHQLGRRNLTNEWIRYLRGKKYLAKVGKQGGSRNGAGRKSQGVESKGHKSSGQNDHLKKTSGKAAKEVAAEDNVGEKTVRRDAKFVSATDRLAPDLRQRVLNREIKIPAHTLQPLSELDHQDQLDVWKSVRDGDHSNFTDALESRGVAVKSQSNGKATSNGKQNGKANGKPVASKKPEVHASRIEEAFRLISRVSDEWAKAKGIFNSNDYRELTKLSSAAYNKWTVMNK